MDKYKYISKSALVAEIERRINVTNLDSIEDWRYRLQREHDIEIMKDILSFINTLEVKEVDLEKEIDKFYGMYRKNGKTYSTEDNEECLDWKVDCNPNFVKAFAKHFFELGLKAQKG